MRKILVLSLAILAGCPESEKDSSVDTGAEICDGQDNDGDGATDVEDDSLMGNASVYVDNDGDNYGTGDPVDWCVGTTPWGYAFRAGDCNDYDSTIHPDADDPAGGVDRNCDGIP